MRHNFFFLFALTYLFGCSNTNQNNIEELFTNRKYINGEVLITEPKVLAPVEIFVTTNSDIILTEMYDNYFAAIIDSTSGKINRFCKIGKGPNEHIPPLYFSRSINRSLSFFSPRTSDYFTYKIIQDSTDVPILDSQYSGFKNISNLVEVSNNLFVSTALNSSLSDNRYNVCDSLGHIIYAQLAYPENNRQPIPDNLKSIAFQSCLAVKPNSNLIISACKFVEHFEILEIYPDSIDRIFELHNSQLIFDNHSSNNFMSIKPAITNKMGFLCVDVAEDCIYLLHSGRCANKVGKQKAYMGNKILKFNWQGEPLEHISLDHDIISFSVNDKYLYAIGLDSIPKIFKYELNE